MKIKFKPIKVIEEEYNPETRKTKIIIDTDLGHFTGWAIKHPDDKANYMLGCAIAEYRARIEYAKNKRYLAQLQLKNVKLVNKMWSNGKQKYLEEHIEKKIKKIKQELDHYRYIVSQLIKRPEYILEI